MPSLIGAPLGGGAPGTTTQNYLVTVPTSKFGTRELAVVIVELNGIGTNYEDSDSLFTQTVRAIQQNAEVYTVFNPSSNRLALLVAADTLPQDAGDEAGDGNRISYLNNVLTDAGITGHDVFNAEINGTNINYD
jgi:hypothetical protein